MNANEYIEKYPNGKEMPALTTGMFGETIYDNDCFVVVNDSCVFENGEYNLVEQMQSYPEEIGCLLNDVSFGSIKDGFENEPDELDFIWINPDYYDEYKIDDDYLFNENNYFEKNMDDIDEEEFTYRNNYARYSEW